MMLLVHKSTSVIHSIANVIELRENFYYCEEPILRGYDDIASYEVIDVPSVPPGVGFSTHKYINGEFIQI